MFLQKIINSSCAVALCCLSIVGFSQAESTPNADVPYESFPQGVPQLLDEMDSISYTVGMSMVTSLNQIGLDSVDLLEMFYGMQDQLQGKAQISPEFANHYIQTFLQKKQMEKSVLAQRDIHIYMKANANGEGVVSLPSGLQYKVLTQGKGPKPKDGDTVEAHYVGKLTNGKVFDSSIDRGRPFVFELNKVIKGWTEAIKLMPVGSKWILTIPPNLAYGDQDNGAIPGNSILIFEVELLRIVNK